MSKRASAAIIALSAILLVACEATPDDAGDDEVGDGDGDPSGDGDGDGDGGDSAAEDALVEQCSAGCNHFLTCAPDEFAGLYADLAACEATCLSLWGACELEALAYFECFTMLACPDVVIAATVGPDATDCGPTYAVAQAACGR